MTRLLTAPSRRAALFAAAGLGLSVTFLGRQAFAASEGAAARRKLVVVICRGAMDGLSVSPPVGDPDYRGLRGEIAIAGFGQPGGALPLDDTFGLHPKLTAIHDWVDIIRTRQPIGLCVPDSRFDIREDAPHLDTYWMDENEELVPTGRDWLHE